MKLKKPSPLLTPPQNRTTSLKFTKNRLHLKPKAFLLLSDLHTPQQLLLVHQQGQKSHLSTLSTFEHNFSFIHFIEGGVLLKLLWKQESERSDKRAIKEELLKSHMEKLCIKYHSTKDEVTATTLTTTATNLTTTLTRTITKNCTKLKERTRNTFCCTEHFLLHCHSYDSYRTDLLDSVNSTLQPYDLPNLSNALMLKLILYGDERLSVDSNSESLKQL